MKQNRNCCFYGTEWRNLAVSLSYANSFFLLALLLDLMGGHFGNFFGIFGKCWKEIVEWLFSCLTFLEDFCLKCCKWGRTGITLWSFHTKFSLVFFIHGLNPLFRPLKEVLLSTKTQIYANLSRCPWLKLHFRIHEQLNLLQSKRTRRTEYSK